MFARLRQWRLWRKGFLFRYFDGRSIRYVDPRPIYRQIVYHPDRITELLDAVERDSEPETTQFIDALADIFQVVRYDPATGKGLTDRQVVELFVAFCQFCADVKKKVNPSSN